MPSLEQEFETKLTQLNPAQLKAVETVYGAVVVNAGPGTGKSQLLSMRMAYILRHLDVLPQNILSLTFTEAAAGNMQLRLASIIGPEAYKATMTTFHSFAGEVFNRYGEFFFQGARFQPADEFRQYQIIESCLQKLPASSKFIKSHPVLGNSFLRPLLNIIKGLKEKGFTPEEYQDFVTSHIPFWTSINSILQEKLPSVSRSKVLIPALEEILNDISTVPDVTYASQNPAFLEFVDTYSQSKDLLLNTLRSSLEDSLETGKTAQFQLWKKSHMKKNKLGKWEYKDYALREDYLQQAILYKAYAETMWQQGFFDFNDMILEVVKALENPENLDLQMSLQEQYQFILVDEFQDTNGLQLRLVQALLEKDNLNPNILVVGDGDQTIYKFQGAESDNLLQFHTHYKQAVCIDLTYNYRSTQDILDLATEVIETSINRPQKAPLLSQKI